jgi:hypothetical protein
MYTFWLPPAVVATRAIGIVTLIGLLEPVLTSPLDAHVSLDASEPLVAAALQPWLLMFPALAGAVDRSNADRETRHPTVTVLYFFMVISERV